jgi:hypothetical protein
MLTIQNLNKLNNKTLGKRNFYVEKIEEQFSIDNITYSASEYQYKITITNRKYAITITLNRESKGFENNFDYKLTSSTGNVLYITKREISNMDIFIDKLRLVALSKLK